MSMGAIFTRRVRGVRLIEVWAVGLLAVLVFGLYLSKTLAGREAADITRTKAEIVQEQTHIRLLKAEVAYLEQPERIERLSQLYLHLEPMSGKRETDPEGIADIVRRPAPQPAPVATAPADPTVPAPSAVAPIAMALVATPPLAEPAR
jgi:hypothetical protein